VSPGHVMPITRAEGPAVWHQVVGVSYLQGAERRRVAR
jgi:hypothetical protein